MRVSSISVAAPVGLALSLALASGAAAAPPGSGCPTDEHLFLFEDTNGVLSNPNNGFAQIRGLMVEAAREVILTHGDEFDFIGFWTSFSPQARFGGAFFTIVENDVQGIGLAQFDQHNSLQIPGDRLEGMLMMYDLGSHSDIQNALYHEFGHRWVAYLPPLPGNRTVQSLTNPAHYSCAIDLQGGVHGAEWVGDGRLRNASQSANADTGGRFSYLDLYLAGIVSAAEMDAGMSEQRYLDQAASTCPSQYTGPVSTWSSADIITVAGSRVPDASSAQRDFTVAWVVIHEVGVPPTSKQLGDITKELVTLGDTWSGNMLGRSTLEQRLFEDADCDGVPDGPIPDCNDNGVLDSQDIATGTSQDCDGNGVPDECDFNEDCNENGVLDACDIASGTSTDMFPQNGRPDECDIITITAAAAAGPGGELTAGCWFGESRGVDRNGDGRVDAADLADFLAGAPAGAEEILHFLDVWFDHAR